MTQKRKSAYQVKTNVDQYGRKKFRLEEKEDESEEEKPNSHLIDVGRHKSMLAGRQQNLNIDKYIGKIQKNKKLVKKEVFYCEICKEGFKCDLAYITHLNSPHHNRKIGMNMKVKAVSKETVVEKLRILKEGEKTKEEEEIEQFVKNQNAEDVKDEAKEEQEILQSQQYEDQVEEEMRKLGLPTSFGSKKIKR